MDTRLGMVEGELREADLWALTPSTTAMLVGFAEFMMFGCYPAKELAVVRAQGPSVLTRLSTNLTGDAPG